MRTFKIIIALLLVLLANTVSAVEEDAFYDFNGDSQSIESFIGDDKWLVMMIWASDCHICNQEAEGYAHLYENNKNKIRVLGLSIDGLSKISDAKEFIESHDLPFTNLISEPAEVMMYYQEQTLNEFIGTPSFMVFNPEGQLMAAQGGAVPPEVIKNFIAKKSSPNRE